MARSFLSSVDSNVWNRDVAEIVKDLWKDDTLKEVFRTKAEFLQINETAD